MYDLGRSDALRHYQGLVLVGSHAMEGTRDGFLNHTNFGYTALRINGQDFGEPEELAWLLGYFGVPTLFVSGDAAACREARALLPGVHTVVVKTAIDRARVVLLPPGEGRARIESGACAALRDLPNSRVYCPKPPIRLEVSYMHSRMADAAANMPRATRIDDRTMAYPAADYWEALIAAETLMDLASTARHAEIMAVLQKQEGVQAAMREFFTDLARIRVEQPAFPAIRL
jgi:D-amino peptidase